jgi:hypothetical protein
MKLVGWEISRGISTAVALPLLLLGSSETKSAPANTLRELYTAIGECVKSARAGLRVRNSRFSSASSVMGHYSEDLGFLTPNY